MQQVYVYHVRSQNLGIEGNQELRQEEISIPFVVVILVFFVFLGRFLQDQQGS